MNWRATRANSAFAECQETRVGGFCNCSPPIHWQGTHRRAVSSNYLPNAACKVSRPAPHLTYVQPADRRAPDKMTSTSDLTFNDLVERYRQPLAAAAYHLCGDRDAAQDIVQETLVDAYRGIEGLRQPDKAASWLYTILRRKAVAHRRLRRTDTSLTDNEPAAGGPGESEALVRGIVMERLEALSVEDREVLAGKYLLGLSYRELAESLGITENAVGVRCFRAMERLREALRGVGLEVPDKRR